ncbi:MAG: CBS domain-containing protein [Candidatus Deferrimicrobiaceae bacterium]
MTKDPKTVGPDDPLTRAADIMRKHRFNHLPVVEGGKLVGILSDTDLRNVFLTSDRLSVQGEPNLKDRKVREVMKTEVWSLTPDDAVEDALLIIQRKKFGALPVLDGDRLVGIITKLDIINTFIDVLDIDDVGLRVEVVLPRPLSRFEELVDAVRELGVGLRSCLITPETKGSDRMVVLLRLDTVNGPMVRGALRAKKFDVLDPASDIL